MNDCYLYTEHLAIKLNGVTTGIRYEHIGTTDNAGFDTHAIILTSELSTAYVFRTAQEAWEFVNRLPKSAQAVMPRIPLEVYKQWAQDPEGKNIYAEEGGVDTIGFDALCLYACLQTRVLIADGGKYSNPAAALLGFVELSQWEFCDDIDAELRGILLDSSHPEHAEVWENCLAVMIVKDREGNAYNLTLNKNLYAIPAGIPIPRQYNEISY